MGWGSGNGKGEVLNAAVGDPIVAGSSSDDHPFNGKLVFIDISGLAHKAAKKDAATVVREGVSAAQMHYVRKQIGSVAAEGGTPVLVLDGRAYPPKLATREARREAAAAARVEAERLAGLGQHDEARHKWEAAAGPQEAFWQALLDECVRHKILFIVAPYEADAQLVALAEAYGEQSIIWAASNDSDIVAFGGSDVVYDWDAFGRQHRRVRLLEDILGKVVGARSFIGWTYDRFLIFTILSGNDYFKNLPGFALRKVYTAMASASLPSTLVAPDPHPALNIRPAAWYADASLLLYAAPVLDAVAQSCCWTGAQRCEAGERAVAAYHAIRQHPVSKLRSMGPDALAPASLEVATMEPLSELERPVGSTLDVIIPGVEIEADAVEATAWACGRLRLNEGELVERRLFNGRDLSDHDREINEDWGDVEGGDGDAVPVALDGSKVTKDTVATADPAVLRAFLMERGLDFYASTSQRELRRLASKLLESGVPALDPAHPALHRHSRPNRHLKLLNSNICRGADVWDIVQYLKQGGLLFDQATRDVWLPFENTRARGRRLYDSEATFRSGHVRAGSRSHAHSTTITAQPAVYAPPGKPAEAAYVFRMAVHASMRQIDHVAMLAVTTTAILLAPNSCCSCEVGIECSHLYCLMIVLWIMQQVTSWDDFRTTVLCYNKKKAPSGAAVWESRHSH